MKYYLAIDIGASSGRHILAWLDNGKIHTEEIYRFANGPESLMAYDGKKHLMWSYERLFSEVVNGLKRAYEIGKIPYSIGIDTWGVDYLLLDENDEEIDLKQTFEDDDDIIPPPVSDADDMDAIVEEGDFDDGFSLEDGDEDDYGDYDGGDEDEDLAFACFAA